MKGLARVSRSEKGFTLIELLVVMTIFVIIMLITTNSFNIVLKQVGQQVKSMETEIGSIIGLEVMRSDLQNAGYGLPWEFQSTPSYTEIATTDTGVPMTLPFVPSGTSPRTFNDAASSVPRAVQSGTTTFNYDPADPAKNGSKYLVLKSLSVAPGQTQKKWVTVTYGDAGRNPLTTYGVADRDLATTDHVIVLRNTFSDNTPSRQLQVRSSGMYSTTFDNYTALTVPHSSGDVFEVYGVDPANDLRMPFNRADYYISTPAKKPPFCAPNTGILYKTIVNQTSGFTEMPLLDCAADMEVVYGSGPAGSSEVNFHSTTLPGTGSATDIRQQLKEIRVYILAHEGKKDLNYTYPTSTVTVGENFGAGVLGRTFNLSTIIGTGWQNYRWKVYTIVTRPKNLIQ